VHVLYDLRRVFLAVAYGEEDLWGHLLQDVRSCR
jgi:hypothetical protein